MELRAMFYGSLTLAGFSPGLRISAGSMLHREGKWCLNLLGDSPTAYDLVSQ